MARLNPTIPDGFSLTRCEIMENEVNEILKGYADAFNIPFGKAISHFTIDDNKHDWNSFIKEIVEPALVELKEIHDGMPVNALLPIVDSNAGIVLSQRQAFQTIIANAFDMMSSNAWEEGSLPLSISRMLEQRIIA